MNQSSKLLPSAWVEVQVPGASQPSRVQAGTIDGLLRGGQLPSESVVQLVPQGPWLPARDVAGMLAKPARRSLWWVWLLVLLLVIGALGAGLVGVVVVMSTKATTVAGPGTWCQRLESAGVAEQCKDEKTDSAAGTRSVAFTLASDHKTWAAVTVYDSDEIFDKEKAAVESGRGLLGQTTYFGPRGARAMVTIAGVPTDQERDRIRTELILGTPAQ